MTLEQILKAGLTLEQVTQLYLGGRVTWNVYEEYYHVWYTSTPRYDNIPCDCQACRATKSGENPR